MWDKTSCTEVNRENKSAGGKVKRERWCNRWTVNITIVGSGRDKESKRDGGAAIEREFYL